MNHLSDQGLILSVRPHGDNGAIIHLLSQDHGKIGGYVNGGQSSTRLRSLLQPGNCVSFEWHSKSEGQLGRFDLELHHDYTTPVFDQSMALTAIKSACALIDLFVPVHEKHQSLYNGTCALFGALSGDDWPAIYIVWEIAFLKELGYGIDLSKCAVTGSHENLTHLSPKSGRAVCAQEAAPYRHKLLEIPQFLQGSSIANDDIQKGLKMVEYFLIHRLLQQSSFQQLPDARHQLQSYFNDP